MIETIISFVAAIAIAATVVNILQASMPEEENDDIFGDW